MAATGVGASAPTLRARKNWALAPEGTLLFAPRLFMRQPLVSLAYRLAIRDRGLTMRPARSVPHRREDNSRVRFLGQEAEGQLRKVLAAKYYGIYGSSISASNGATPSYSVQPCVGNGRLAEAYAAHSED